MTHNVSPEGDGLEPCPFCGSTAIRLQNGIGRTTDGRGWQQQVWCVQCLAVSREEPTREQAIAAWNTRTSPAEPVPQPNTIAAAEFAHAQEVERQEIADGAYGDNPAIRGAARDTIAAGQREAVARVDQIEELAQFLHDEGGFGDAYPDRTWPEHPDDTGQREGGFVKLVPSDVQAKFRDVARRWLGSRLAIQSPDAVVDEREKLATMLDAQSNRARSERNEYPSGTEDWYRLDHERAIYDDCASAIRDGVRS